MQVSRVLSLSLIIIIIIIIRFPYFTAILLVLKRVWVSLAKHLLFAVQPKTF